MIEDISLTAGTAVFSLDSVPEAGCGESGDCSVSESTGPDSHSNFRTLMNEPYREYRSGQTFLTWLPESGNQLGLLSGGSDPYLNHNSDSGFVTAFNIHWLSRPTSAPLPPRLYDAVFGYQWREQFSSQLSYDLYASVGVFTDFEDSARDGGRFRSHAVGMWHVDPSTDIVFGVDYKDRDQIQVLPVFGISIHNIWMDDLRIDLVFLHPRVTWRLSDSHRMYLAGEIEGGEWDIEFPNEANHVISYNDYRLILGFEHLEEDGSLSALEFGYSFERRLRFRGIPGDTAFNDGFVIRWVTGK